MAAENTMCCSSIFPAYLKIAIVSLLTLLCWYRRLIDDFEIYTLLAVFFIPFVLMGREILSDLRQIFNIFMLLTFAAWGYFGQASLMSFLSGGFGGVCLVLVGHPMDLVKVKLQTSNEFSGTFDCLRHTIRREGLGGLYKGLMAPLIGTAPVFAICFWGYEVGQNLVCLATGKSVEDGLNLLEICLAGGFSAIPTTVIMAPMERIKCLLQTQSSGNKEEEEGNQIVSAATGQQQVTSEEKSMPQFDGMVDCASYLFWNYGLGSVFKGWDATLLRDVPGSVAYFFVYEVLNILQSGGDPQNLSLLNVLCSGGFAGIACWLVCIPPDTLKTRLQTAPEGKYSGMWDAYRELMAEGGWGQFYTGIVPVVIRAFPANAACFFGVQLAKQAFSYFGLS